MFTAVVERRQCHQYWLVALGTLKPLGRQWGEGMTHQTCTRFQVLPVCPSEKSSMNMTTTVDIRGLILIGKKECSKKNLYQVSFVHLKSHIDRPEFETVSLQLAAGD